MGKNSILCLIFALLLSVIMIFSLSSCKNKKTVFYDDPSVMNTSSKINSSQGFDATNSMPSSDGTAVVSSSSKQSQTVDASSWLNELDKWESEHPTASVKASSSNKQTSSNKVSSAQVSSEKTGSSAPSVSSKASSSSSSVASKSPSGSYENESGWTNGWK